MAKKEYTDEEKVRLAKHKERKKRRPVNFKDAESDSGCSITLQDTDDPLVAVKVFEALGTADKDLQRHLLVQVVGTFREVAADGAGNEAVADAANKVMLILSGIQPKDEIEAMLAVQMMGPRTPEGLERSRKANFKHGFYSAELLEERKFIRQLLRNSRETLEQVEKNLENSVLSKF